MILQSVLKSNFQIELYSAAKASKKASDGAVYVLSAGTESQKKAEFKKIIALLASDSQKVQLLQSEKKTIYFNGQNGPVWILKNTQASKGQHNGLLDESMYAWFRDQAGSLVSQFKAHPIMNIDFNFFDADENIVRAVVVGLEMASYNFLNCFNNIEIKRPVLNFFISGKKKSFKLDQLFLQKAQAEAQAIQLARHLVNLPPNIINPASIEELVKKELNFSKNVKIEIWDYKKLVQENMNLLLAVGQGSETPPRMIRISYRPKQSKAKKPLAFVGKGITFDTGGLDIKPSSGMRLMKKDMGGAAAVLGLAYWAVHSNYSRACDFYLALAENSVDAKSMRPSDLYRSRAGYLVEIDNTDAEGRLVLADVMDVAATQKGADEAEVLVDIATLTGAIKVALGADVAGLFTNDDQLAQQMQAAGQAAGDLNWRMPLVQKYFGGMSTPFADFKNSADGFGGAITAALFLEKFCGGKKWAHLDVYSWNDKVTGAYSSAGGSGQPVQAMIEWLKRRA
jgi:leucyl aminopeptidase